MCRHVSQMLPPRVTTRNTQDEGAWRACRCARTRGGESVTALLDGTPSSSGSEEEGKGAEAEAVGGQVGDLLPMSSAIYYP